jgi:hypothetical protein
MELKNFVSSTIEEISLGILEAKEKLKGTNAIVSPDHIRTNSVDSQAYARTVKPTKQRDADDYTRVVQKVEFDIAVTIDESDKTAAGAKISVLSIGLGGDIENTSKTGSSSRIKFFVPIVFPTNET